MEKNSVLELKLKEIACSKFNPRKHFDDKKMGDLVLSIKEKGVIQPIIVRKQGQGYEIVCGERRYRASEKAGKTSIPALVRHLTDDQVLEFQVIENLQREDVHPLEEAEGYEALLKNHGYKTVDDIAAKVGKSRTYIYGRLKLCELIPENKKLFYGDKFSPSVALLIARIPSHLQKEAAKELMSDDEGDGISYRVAYRYIEHNLMLQLKDARFDPKDETLGGKVGSCVKCTKRTGNQKELFPDVSSADVCTDPECFHMKKNAFYQRTIAQAKENGKKVLSMEECKKLFPYQHSDEPNGSKYVSLKSTCYDDSKYRKYGQIIKGLKDVEIIYGINPHTGDLVELLDKAKILALLKKSGVKLKDECGTDKYKQDQSKARKEERIRKMTAARVAAAVAEKVNKDNAGSYLRIMGQAIIRKSSFDGQRMFTQRRDPNVKGGDVYPFVEKLFKDLKDNEILGFCIELISLDEAVYGSGYGTTSAAFCKHYNIDAKQILAGIKKDLESKKKGKDQKEAE